MIFPTKFLVRRGKEITEKLLNVTIYRSLPRGIHPIYDLRRLLPEWIPIIIFDVGANIGQEAGIYSKQFPSAQIFSFEPSLKTFEQLEQNTAGFHNVRCYRCAFGSEDGDVALIDGGHSLLNRVIPKSSPKEDTGLCAWENVRQRTVDGFCQEEGVDRIGYLKIDTEGADLEVLRGAGQMLSKGVIDVLEVEVGIGPDNDLHVPLHDVMAYLTPRGYLIFGFYDQVHEFKRRLPHLRRANVVFISTAFESRMSQLKSNRCY